MSEARLEAAARALASLEPGEDWPTNEALGGSLAGTRGDEYRDGMRMMAKDALDAADAYDAAHGIHRINVDDDTVMRVFGLVSNIRALWDDKGLDASDYLSVKDEAREALLDALKSATL